jgi:BirA family biotin operon repressor/biotin-[acetyl-CoA-carboxylase] ligase
MEYPLSAQAAAGFLYLEQTGSTNKDLLAKATGLPEFYVLATDFQSAGKGRMDRSWEASPGSSIMASILLRPLFTQSTGIGWLSLLTALAISRAISNLGLAPKIKWPNDVVIAEKKVSGILAEVPTDLSCVVIGFGINVNQSTQQLPVDTATSLAVENAGSVDRDQLLAEVIENIKQLYGDLSSASGDAQESGLRKAILDSSATVGSQVSVEFPDGKKAFGLAKDIDETGRLVVFTQNETLSVSAGDVLHLRKA